MIFIYFISDNTSRHCLFTLCNQSHSIKLALCLEKKQLAKCQSKMPVWKENMKLDETPQQHKTHSSDHSEWNW